MPQVVLYTSDAFDCSNSIRRTYCASVEQQFDLKFRILLQLELTTLIIIEDRTCKLNDVVWLCFFFYICFNDLFFISLKYLKKYFLKSILKSQSSFF